jgi:uncharacterized protein YjiK
MKDLHTSASAVLLFLAAFLAGTGLNAQIINQDALQLRDVVSLNIQDPSGLSLHSEEGFLWTVSDAAGGNITLITESGQRVSTLSYPGDDMEGISYDAASNSLWIAEEGELELRRLSLQGDVLEIVSVDIGQDTPNNGPEGIAVNPVNGHLFVVNQKNPRVLLELNAAREIMASYPIDFAPPFDIKDLSGLFYDDAQQELWFLSAGSQKIIVTNPTLEPLRRYGLDVEAPEGLAVDSSRDLVFIVSDTNDELYIYDRVSLMNPRPHHVAETDYVFDFWSAEEPDFSYPPHMSFQMSDRDDPRLSDEPVAPYYVPFVDYNPDDEATTGFPYNNTRRTRINGLGYDGISMINTGRGRDLGAVVLALNTTAAERVLIDWEAETLVRNSRVYAFRLQYRTNTHTEFMDVLHDGEVVEYKRGPFNGHQQFFEDISLPSDALNKPYVQLRWKFYYTGEQTGGGGRDELRLDNIRVRSGNATAAGSSAIPQQVVLLQNYPNPFNPSTRISYILKEPSEVRLDVFTLGGEHIIRLDEGHRPTGRHNFNFDAGALSLSSGLYLYRLTVDGKTLPVKQMLLIR